MSQFKNTSWGRTRRPKSVHGASGTAQAASSTNAPSNNAADNSDQGYSTENQRFLHMLLDTDASGDDRTVTVYGYTYASNRWSTMRDVRGNPISLQCDNTSIYQIFEISGVDRVYFQINGDGLDARDFFYAAFSTF
jgi:hypothetical protein